MKFDLPIVNFGAFGLDQEPSKGEVAILAFVDLYAVDEIGHVTAPADGFDVIPFAGGFFDILGPAKSRDVLPLRIAILPVDSSGVEFGGSAGRSPDATSGQYVARQSNCDWRCDASIIAVHQEDVTGATFDNLELHRTVPRRQEGFNVIPVL